MKLQKKAPKPYVYVIAALIFLMITAGLARADFNNSPLSVMGMNDLKWPIIRGESGQPSADKAPGIVKVKLDKPQHNKPKVLPKDPKKTETQSNNAKDASGSPKQTPGKSSASDVPETAKSQAKPSPDSYQKNPVKTQQKQSYRPAGQSGTNYYGRLEMLGFYTDPEPPIPGSLGILQKHADVLTFIAPFYFRIGAESGITENWNTTTDAKIKQVVTEAHQRNVQVLALVHNLLYGKAGVGKQVASEMLKDEASRKKFIDSLLAIVRNHGFDGVNLDIEDINYSDRNNFSALVKETKEAFKPHGLLLTVSVPPETGQFIPGSWSRNFDYAAIGRWADRLVIMTYDEHGYSTGPGPIASRNWVERVIKYTVSVVPREKVILGVAGYGFDWTVDKRAPKYIPYQTARDLAQRSGTSPLFDENSKTPNFTYVKNNEKHQVWYEDARSFRHKAELAAKWQLKGLGIWRLGMEDPAVWDISGKEFSVVKN